MISEVSETTSPVAAKINECLIAARPALIGYLPLGFPTLDRSIEAVKAMIDAGVDVVELGIPYTDPVMDGPVIQHAATAALAAGARVRDVFPAVRELSRYAQQRAEADGKLPVPILVMTYYNIVLRAGIEEFAANLAMAGGAGLIIPDLTPDEGPGWLRASDRYDLDRVFLVAPSSTPERLALTAAASRGFVYAASTMGVTGVRSQVGAQAERLVADTRDAGAEHVCVGLGVSTADQAAQVGAYADGVIVGSALVKALLGEDATADAGATLSQPSESVWQDRLTNLRTITADLAAGVARSRSHLATAVTEESKQ